MFLNNLLKTEVTLNQKALYGSEVILTEPLLRGSFKRTVRHFTACGFHYKNIFEFENALT